MLKVVEAFSGIGSQAKALRNIGLDFEVVNTIDWDINAIIAYDILHNGSQDLSILADLDKEDLIIRLSRYTLSNNGKEPIGTKSLSRMPDSILRSLYYSIIRTKNLVNVQDVTGNDFNFNIDLLTYSFPCQDLSISGFWHGNEGGISRNANNRSSMLWEIERILLEMKASKQNLPRFLLMENVTAIRSDRHVDNFNEWKSILVDLGYENVVYDLCAYDFGVPQMRKRTFMISVLVDSDTKLRREIKNFFKLNNLEENPNLYQVAERPKITEYLRLDYNNKKYKEEAIMSVPNDTSSRRKIFEQNPKIFINNKPNLEAVRTITTKQDRHPNSGVIEVPFKLPNKSNFRYLTPRECFIFMGFDENDYENLIINNFPSWRNNNFFTKDKLIKMAGNSIVVNVLESVFLHMYEIDKFINEYENEVN